MLVACIALPELGSLNTASPSLRTLCLGVLKSCAIYLEFREKIVSRIAHEQL